MWNSTKNSQNSDISINSRQIKLKDQNQQKMSEKSYITKQDKSNEEIREIKQWSERNESMETLSNAKKTQDVYGKHENNFLV